MVKTVERLADRLLGLVAPRIEASAQCTPDNRYYACTNCRVMTCSGGYGKVVGIEERGSDCVWRVVEPCNYYLCGC